jgi:hypothetical protein
VVVGSVVVVGGSVVVVVGSVVVVVGSVVVVVGSVVVVVGSVVVGDSVVVEVEDGGVGRGVVVGDPVGGGAVVDGSRSDDRRGTIAPIRAGPPAVVGTLPATRRPAALVELRRSLSTASSSVSPSAPAVVPAPDPPAPSASPAPPDGKRAACASPTGSSDVPTSTSVGPALRPSATIVKPMAAEKITAARSASPIHP